MQIVAPGQGSGPVPYGSWNGPPALPPPRYSYSGEGGPNQREQDVQKLAECSGSPNPLAFAVCYGGATAQQECIDEGDCLEDVEKTVKKIGYDIADVFGW